MSRRKMKKYPSSFKARVVLETLKNEKTLSQIASEARIDPKNIQNWKKELLENGVFNYMNFYNYKRPHSSLANLTPVEVYEANKEVRETKQQNRKLVLQNAV